MLLHISVTSLKIKSSLCRSIPTPSRSRRPKSANLPRNHASPLSRKNTEILPRSLPPGKRINYHSIVCTTTKSPHKPGATPPFGTIYSMSPVELEILRKSIQTNLRKGFIRHSQSPCGALILFAKKPDDTHRLCVDYRGLNEISTKNCYSLPLIGELLDRISRAKFFPKFDILESIR